MKKEQFTHNENERFIEYINKIKHYLPKHYQFIKKKRTPHITGAYLKYDLQRADYILAFNMLIDAF
jgi:hypothetical protein